MKSRTRYGVSYIDRYTMEVYNMTRYYEDLNSKQPTTTRKPTAEELELFRKASETAIKNAVKDKKRKEKLWRGAI